MKRAALTVALLVLLSAFIVTIAIPPEARASTLYVGGTDSGNYTTIQAAIDDANPGDTIYVYNGTYYENIVVYKSLSLVGEDRDTTTIDGGGFFEDVLSITADWVNITGFTATNSMEGHTGIGLSSVQNCNITNNNASDNYFGFLLESSSANVITYNNASDNYAGIFLYLSSGNSISDNNASNNTLGISVTYDSDVNYIADNNVSENWRGIHLSSSSSNTITGNLMVEDGISLEGSSLEYWNTHIIDTSNTVNGKPVYYWKNVTGGTIPLGAGQVILSNCTDVIVENQNVSGGSVGFQISFSSDNTIANNTASWNNVYGIGLLFSQNHTIINNNASSNSWGDGVYLYSSSNNTITNNTVFFNRWDGISLEQSSDHNIISNNTASTNNHYGIDLSDSDSNNITDNIASNSQRGIYLVRSSGNLITSNNVSNNQEGIFIWLSKNNTVANNIVSSNGRGISLQLSTNISVHHNNLIANTVQATDNNGNENSWDDGYPLGGNYWSDYTGVDGCSGPDQDVCPDPDGIGDESYVIDADSEDRYPLMNPVALPSAPQNVQATAGNQQVTLTWSAPASDGGSSITNYSIYRGTTSGGEIFLVEIGNVLIFTDTGLMNGQTYYYEVSASNAVGEGPKSNEVSATPATVPRAPTGLTAVAGDEQITLTWSAPSDDGGSSIRNYMIYRGTSSGGETLLITIGNVLSYVDTGLTNGVTYYYQVAAVNGVGEGPKSNEANATPVAPSVNQPPVCTIITPTSGATISGMYTITGTADDIDGTVERVEIRIDDGAWIEVTGTTSWSYDWNTSTVSDGNHAIYARSYDGTNYSDEVNVSVIVDNATPPPPGEEESIFEQGWFWITVAVVIAIILMVIFILIRRRKEKQGEGESPESG